MGTQEIHGRSFIPRGQRGRHNELTLKKAKDGSVDSSYLSIKPIYGLEPWICLGLV